MKGWEAKPGIGFHYNGAGGSGERFVPKAALKKVRDVTLKDGTPGAIHEFVGLGGCWRGSTSSSLAASYAFKPYMQFTAAGETFRNWEPGGNHAFNGGAISMDRTNELLR